MFKWCPPFAKLSNSHFDLYNMKRRRKAIRVGKEDESLGGGDRTSYLP